MINSSNKRQIIIGFIVAVAAYGWICYSFVVLQNPILGRMVYIVVLCFGGGYLLYRSLTNNKKEVFEIEMHRSPVFLTTWLSIVAMAVVWGATLLFRPGIVSPETIGTTLDTYGTPLKNYWWFAGFFTIMNPIAEEFLWRRNMVPLLRSMMGRYQTIVVSALLFAGYHVLAIIKPFELLMLLGVFLICFTGGIFLAYLYIRTRHIRYPIALHMVININLAVIWWFYTPS